MSRAVRRRCPTNGDFREHVRALARDGLLSGLSVSFKANRDADQWTPPPVRGADRLATVLRRGVRLREVSLVSEPALEGSRVESIRNRSVASTAAPTGSPTGSDAGPGVGQWSPLIPEVQGAEQILDDAERLRAEQRELLELCDHLWIARCGWRSKAHNRASRQALAQVAAKRAEEESAHRRFAEEERRSTRERRLRIAAGLPPEPTPLQRLAWSLGRAPPWPRFF